MSIPCRQCPVLPMCKHKFTVECLHLYDYLLTMRGVRSLDKKGLKNIADIFNKPCTRVTCYSVDAAYIRGQKSIFVDFDNGFVLMVERGCNDEK